MATELERGRPKLENPRTQTLNLRLAKNEAEKISKIAQKLGITKTDAILRGIDLLINYKPKIYRSQLNKNKPPTNVNKVQLGSEEGEIVPISRKK